MSTNQVRTHRRLFHQATIQSHAATSADGMSFRPVAGSPDDEVQMQEGQRHVERGWYQEDATTATLLMRVTLIGAFIAYMLVIAQWGWHLLPEEHAEAAEPSIEAPPESQAATALHMGPVSTGVVVVDDAVRGFLIGDVDAAFSQLIVRRVPCGSLPWGGRPALACLAAEAPGTAHDVILSACEAKWMTGEAARAELATLLTDTPGLHTVSRVSSGYRAVLSWPDALDRSLVLTITSAGVTSYGAGCGLPAAPKDGHELNLVTAAGG